MTDSSVPARPSRLRSSERLAGIAAGEVAGRAGSPFDLRHGARRVLVERLAALRWFRAIWSHNGPKLALPHFVCPCCALCEFSLRAQQSWECRGLRPFLESPSRTLKGVNWNPKFVCRMTAFVPCLNSRRQSRDLDPLRTYRSRSDLSVVAEESATAIYAGTRKVCPISAHDESCCRDPKDS
jgi:hypothetical protein